MWRARSWARSSVSWRWPRRFAHAPRAQWPAHRCLGSTLGVHNTIASFPAHCQSHRPPVQFWPGQNRISCPLAGLAERALAPRARGPGGAARSRRRAPGARGAANAQHPARLAARTQRTSCARRKSRRPPKHLLLSAPAALLCGFAGVAARRSARRSAEVAAEVDSCSRIRARADSTGGLILAARGAAAIIKDFWRPPFFFFFYQLLVSSRQTECGAGSEDTVACGRPALAGPCVSDRGAGLPGRSWAERSAPRRSACF